MDRRTFFKGIIAAMAAPAICKAENLMRIAPPKGYRVIDHGMFVPDYEGILARATPGEFPSGDFTAEAHVKPSTEDGWMHVAFCKSSEGMREYLQGEEVPPGTLAGMRINLRDIVLKSRAPENAFQGKVDEIRIITGVSFVDAMDGMWPWK